MKRRLTARLGRVALAVAATASLLGCASVMTDRAEDCFSAPASMPAPRRGALTEAELQMAQRAWLYFENNYQSATGFVNAVQDYPSTTMWDTASYIAALLAAHELGLIDKNRFDTRFAALMRTLQTMELFRNEQPNKVYHTRTAAKVDYANQPGEIGFSAIDMGRLLVWLKIVKERRPEHANAIDRFMLRLDFRRVVDWSGTLHGALLDGNKQVQYVQEGRLGYEEYAAKGFELWGFDASQALAPEPFDTLSVYGQAVPYDTRDPRTTNQHNYVVAESYVLDALELNWDQALDRGSDDLYHSQCWMADFGHRIYLAQEGRWRTTGILTARTEHQLDREPYFVYDTVFSDGFAWNTITDTGQYKPEAAAVSLKAALGMWVLWPTPYTEQLFDAVATAYDPNKGYFEGLYENGSGPIRTQTANNNGIMLEALLYKVQGKLLKWGPNDDGGLWETGGADPFAGNDRGRPRFKREAQSFYKVGAPRSLEPGRTWRDNRKVDGVRQPACGRCGSCANTVYPYSATWRVMPGR